MLKFLAVPKKQSVISKLQPESSDRIPTTIYSELEDSGVTGVVTGVPGSHARTTDDVDYVKPGMSIQLPGRYISPHLETRPAAKLTKPVEQQTPVSRTTVVYPVCFY